jgi:hypothetical protein
MAQANTQAIMPRRGFLSRALGFTAAGATLALPAVATSAAPVVSPLVGPITPDQYIAEIHAMGWRVFSGTYINSQGHEAHAGVIERRPDDGAGLESDENYLRLRRLRHATSDSGLDFFKRASDRLYELGLRQVLDGPMRTRGIGDNTHDHATI